MTVKRFSWLEFSEIVHRTPIVQRRWNASREQLNGRYIGTGRAMQATRWDMHCNGTSCRSRDMPDRRAVLFGFIRSSWLTCSCVERQFIGRQLLQLLQQQQLKPGVVWFEQRDANWQRGLDRGTRRRRFNLLSLPTSLVSHHYGSAPAIPGCRNPYVTATFLCPWFWSVMPPTQLPVNLLILLLKNAKFSFIIIKNIYWPPPAAKRRGI